MWAACIATGTVSEPIALLAFIPCPDLELLSFSSNGLSMGKQALMTPSRASREVKTATRQHVDCVCKVVGSPIVEVAWMRKIVMAQILHQKNVSTYRTLDDQGLVLLGAIHETKAEHAAQRHLFIPRYLQSPQYRHGQNHYQNVLETVQDGDVHIERSLISARAVYQTWRPSERYRPTDEAVRDDCARAKGHIHRQHCVASDE